MSICRYIYNPTSEPMKFTVHYDNEATAQQQRRASAVIAHLEALSHEELVKELQAEYFADDLHPPYPAALSWSLSRLRNWFEAGGSAEHMQA